MILNETMKGSPQETVSRKTRDFESLDLHQFINSLRRLTRNL